MIMCACIVPDAQVRRTRFQVNNTSAGTSVKSDRTRAFSLNQQVDVRIGSSSR